MNKNQGRKSSNNDSGPEIGINRCEMVRRLVMVGGSGLALPGIAERHPLAGSFANTSSARETGAQTAKAGWSPGFLNLHQSQTLEVLPERIIPGSSRAQVNRFIDFLLSVDTLDAQNKFLASISAFDADSLRRYAHPYKNLSESRQNEILTSASTTEHEKAADGESRQFKMHDHSEDIKNWVAEA